jgi:hypothetical protein
LELAGDHQSDRGRRLKGFEGPSVRDSRAFPQRSLQNREFPELDRPLGEQKLGLGME